MGIWSGFFVIGDVVRILGCCIIVKDYDILFMKVIFCFVIYDIGWEEGVYFMSYIINILLLCVWICKFEKSYVYMYCEYKGYLFI